MPLNLGALNPDAAASLIEPRDIYAALTVRPWPTLRQAQGEVLGKWVKVRTRSDVVIKQNTGGGKTAVGLLIAQSGLNERVGPSVYLVPDTYLVRQVVAEAEKLGLPITTNMRDRTFRSGEATLVATFNKLINGRSAFGVRGSGKTPIPLGSVIVDDAHAALGAAQNAFTARIPGTHAAYEQLLQIFSGDLKAQSAKTWLDIINNDTYRSSALRIPFWSWASHHEEVLGILREYGDDNDKETMLESLYYAWPLVADYLQLATASLTSKELEIKLPCPAIDMIPSFATAKRRIYLTATLADDSVLVTELNADPVDVASPVTPDRASDLGDRIILAPLALNPQLWEGAIRELARQFADGDRDGDGAPDSDPINVVVLVPSNKQARLWAETADETCHVGDLAPVIARLKNEVHIGVIVLVNKYDGVDLPDEACRLLIIDGLPTPLSPSEQRESTALAGGQTYLIRTVQKIEQGMGRGIRDLDDYCAVLVMGNELASTIEANNARSLFSPATAAQIGLSQQISRQIGGEGLVPIRQALKTFLERHTSWVTPSRAAIATVRYSEEGHVADLAKSRRAAFDLAEAGDYAGASACLVKEVNKLPKIERGWFREEVAAYRHQVDPDEAQKMLTQARLENVSSLRPIAAVPVRPLRANALQGRSSAKTLAKYENRTELVLEVGKLLDDIAWDEDATDLTESAFARLGVHLGFATERPDKIYGTGPDVLWVLRDDEHALFELKTGIVRGSKTIAKKEVDQLAGELNWHSLNYKEVTNRIPVLVHPYSITDANATAPAGTRVITAVELNVLKSSVRSFAQTLAELGGWADPEEVTRQLVRNRLTANLLMNAFSVPFTPIAKLKKMGTVAPDRHKVPTPAPPADTATQPATPIGSGVIELVDSGEPLGFDTNDPID